ncbi:acetoacetate decarboxylase [Fusarium sporotrichioides]|uniref:Acetoacetate decarboxylase n=1 Tax=Fusarium sporotrichioides TaxID=5514 RepID=A0A395RL87_FUSSP|nr:acetoacetate decarboxylase [Fusarium sporotrichioides]
MPFGTFKTSEFRGAIPVSSPPYPSTQDEFTDMDVLSIRYYSEHDAVKDLVPAELELAEEPLITLSLIKYGFSLIGPYTEFISSVEVKWQGKTYDYYIELILDNEGAIFAGRERWGFPKVFGKVVWDSSSTNPAAPPGFVTGHAERPVGSKLVQMSIKPLQKVQALGPFNQVSPHLGLRCIPASNPHDPPVLREFIPGSLGITHAEVWTGEGSVGLFNVSEFDPIHRLKVVRYESAMVFRHASATLNPANERFAI